ncbi:MAG: acyltransferase family protein [Gemmatimonadaceae bacterium]
MMESARRDEQQFDALSRAARRHMPALDGWRGLAVLVVVLHNSSFLWNYQHTVPDLLVSNLFATGWVGVTLFFVLSGFLITGILLDTRSSPRYFRDFYLRRTFRIFPLYYVALFIAFVIVAPTLGNAAWVASVHRNQAWYWGYIPNWLPPGRGIVGLDHFWSLGVEEQFYLVWPLLLLVTGDRWFARTAVAIFVGAFVFRWWFLSGGGSPGWLYGSTLARCDALALGALLAYAARSRDWFRPLWRWRYHIFGFAGIVVVAIVLGTHGFEGYDPVVEIVGQPAIALVFAFPLFATVCPSNRVESRLTGWMSAKWLRLLGKYSYAIYVIHVPLHTILRTVAAPVVNGAGPWGSMALMFVYCAMILGLSTLLAIVSWNLIEKRFLLLKDRLAPRRNAPVIATPPLGTT